jgi:hypothetical protein
VKPRPLGALDINIMSNQIALRAVTACPVAELEGRILDAMDELEASICAPFDGNDPFRKKLHDERQRQAAERLSTLREMTTHTLATSPAGLRYQTEELSCAHDELLDDDSGKAALKVDRLVSLIAAAAANLFPSDDPRLAA